MTKPLRIIQLNVRKKGEVHESLMNDEEIQDAAVMAHQGRPCSKHQGAAADYSHDTS